jgi:ubiquinone/menaquinone biosynthesis C-methylase UbiE
MPRGDTKVASRRWFDRRAEGYERGLDSGWLARMQREALAALQLGPDDRFLDVGCGPGATLRQMASSIRFGVGIDLSPEMIRLGRDLARELDRVEFCVADSERLPFEDQAFTAVLCSTSFHHYPNPSQAVGEMARVLAPGGRLVVADASSDLLAARIADVFLRRFEPGHVHLHRAAELGAFVQSAGFSKVRLKRLSSGGYAIVHGIKPGGASPPSE